MSPLRAHLCTLAAAASVAASVAVAVAQPASRGPTYSVRMSRAPQVGARARVTKVVRERQVKITRRPDRPEDVETTSRVATLRAISTVREVDARGRARRFELAVERLSETTDGGRERDVVPPGTTLDVTLATRREDAVVAVGGRPATAEEREGIARVVTLSQGPTTDDDVFGTPTPVRVGRSWPVAAELAAQDLRLHDLVVAPSGVRGRTSLVAARPCLGSTCLDLKADLTIVGGRPAGLPQQARLTRSRLTALVRGLFPVDPSLPSPSGTLRMSGEMVIAVTPTPGVTVEVALRIDNESETSAEPIP